MRTLRSFPWQPSMMALAAGAALVLIWFITSVWYLPGIALLRVPRGAISGDGPHYLVVVNSLLFDHSLEVQNAYARADNHGVDVGALARFRLPDHHTILVNRRTGAHGLWMYSDGGRTIRNPSPAFVAGPDVYEVSAHPVAFPAMLALAVAPFHPRPRDVEHDVGVVLLLIGWAGVVATYLVAREGGYGRTQATLAAALLMLASPWLAYCRAYFSETTIGVVLLFTLAAWIKRRPTLVGALAFVATALKPPFAMVGIGFVVAAIIERRVRDAIAILVVFGSGCVALGGFNYWLARTAIISGSEGWHPATSLKPLFNLFLQPAHGLLIFAPWILFAIYAIWRACRRGSSGAAMVRGMAWPMVFFLALLGFTGFGPGFCYGPRYWVPFLPWFAIAAIAALYELSRAWQVAGAALITVGIAIAIPGALRYPEMFSKPPIAAWQATQIRIIRVPLRVR